MMRINRKFDCKKNIMKVGYLWNIDIQNIKKHT